MKVLVTGSNGQLGYDVLRVLNEKGYNNFLGVDKDEMDLTKESSVKEVILEFKPNCIIHCAAWTAVDLAEDEEERCMDVNVNGTKYIAKYAKEIDAKVIYISTDYVFNGEGETPFSTNDKPNPIGIYGMSKYLGEKEIQNYLDKFFIVRISWVFGNNGNNFIKTMLRLAGQYDQINVVGDQIGSPTYTQDLALLLENMIVTDKYGIYHATNEGFTTWSKFAKEIFKVANKKTIVNSITTEEYPTKAKRPKNSRLDKSNLEDNEFNRLPKWEDALYRYLKEIGEIE